MGCFFSFPDDDEEPSDFETENQSSRKNSERSFRLNRKINKLDILLWNFSVLSLIFTFLIIHYRRTRSKTMSERLRKSIRQKLRPSIFTVSQQFFLKILNIFFLILAFSEKLWLLRLHARWNWRKDKLLRRTMRKMWKISPNSIPC